jgi:hypothetical protein
VIFSLFLAGGSSCRQESAGRQSESPVAANETPVLQSDQTLSAPGAQGNANGKKKSDGMIQNENSRESVPENAFITAVSTLGNFDGIKKFIRTAELKFRVDNVLESTLAIENIVQKNGGFVTENNLVTQIEMRTNTPVSRDSSVEVTRFTVRNQLVVRVPAALLDTTLREVGKLARFLDYRRVKATDVGLDMLEQELAQTRLQSHQEQIGQAIQRSTKPESITRAADHLLASRESSDASRIKTLKIEDAIKYSTVKLDLYGNTQSQHQMLALPRAIASFEPGFGIQLGQALLAGWQLLMGFILLVMKVWSLWLVLGIGWLLWKYRAKF